MEELLERGIKKRTRHLFSGVYGAGGFPRALARVQPMAAPLPLARYRMRRIAVAIALGHKQRNQISGFSTNLVGTSYTFARQTKQQLLSPIFQAQGCNRYANSDGTLSI